MNTATRKGSLGTKIASVVLVVVMVLSSILTVSAEPEAVLVSGDTVTRISNPNGVAGEIDGLIGDRETGYGWAFAERGDYLYIGGWRNTVGAVIAHYLEAALVASGTMDSETVWALTDIITNGEVPRPENSNSGVLVKMDKNDPGNFEIIAEMEDPFRHVAQYEDDLYFATYVGVTGNDPKIYKLDENDVLTEVYTTAQGSSMRANCVYRDYLYFAGTYADAPQQAGEPVSLAVIRKHDEDDGWDLVADYRDFTYESDVDEGNYGNDSFVGATAGSPFWDMTVFNDEIYATIPNMLGYVVFKGHPAKAGEEANEYGWVWTEVIGRDKNSPNNQGLAPDKDGFIDSDSYALGYQSVVGALGVFNGHLYAYDIDHTIAAELMAIQGMLMLISDPMNADLSSYLEPLWTTLNHPQTLWRMDNDSGVFEEMTGFTDLTRGTTNEYIWKHGIYHDEFYISTMDSKVIYNYLTRLTGGSISEMSREEWERQIAFITDFVRDMVADNLEEADIEAMVDRIMAAAANSIPPRDTVEEFVRKLANTVQEIGEADGLQDILIFLAKWADTRDILNSDTADTIDRIQNMIADFEALDMEDTAAVEAFEATYQNLPD